MTDETPSETDSESDNTSDADPAPLVGARIENVRRMTDSEMEDEMWEHSNRHAPVIELSNGIVLYPAADPEGNAPGALFTREGSDRYYVAPE